MNGADLFLIIGCGYLICFGWLQYKQEKAASRTINITHYKENK
jgi:hypothetical protein